MQEILTLCGLLRGQVGAYAGALTFTILTTACYLLLPPQVGMFIESLGHIGKGGSGIATVLPWAVNLVVLLIVASLFALGQALTSSWLSEQIVNGLRLRFFSHAMVRRLDLSKMKPAGELASEFFSDLAIIQDGLSNQAMDLARHLLFSIGGVVALLFINPRMTIFALVGIGLVVAVVFLFTRMLRKSILKIQQARSGILSSLVECASNAYVIQAYERVDFMRDKFHRQLDDAKKIITRHAVVLSLFSPISLFVFAIVLFAALVYGANEVTLGRMDVRGLVTYFTYSLVLVTSFSQLGMTFSRLRQAGAVWKKHAAILEPGAVTPTRASQEVDGNGPLGIRLSCVSFSYVGTDGLVLNDISLEIAPAKATAIIGRSGVGKSTLAALICGVFEPRQGKVEIGQDDLWQPPTALRQKIAVVPQEPFLFAGTFRDNISFGREGITDSEIGAAAEHVGMHEFIDGQPNGYGGRIEEGGGNLSRGQRQRIAIARAIVGRPSILILDEATASLDPVSERVIVRLVERLKRRITIVIVAHKGEILDVADVTFQLDADSGIHEPRAQIRTEAMKQPLEPAVSRADSY